MRVYESGTAKLIDTALKWEKERTELRERGGRERERQGEEKWLLQLRGVAVVADAGVALQIVSTSLFLFSWHRIVV